MPRAKADSVIIHRIDLQPGVKESLDTYLAANAITKAVGVAGQTLVGFVGVLAAPLGALMAALIAKEGVEEIAGIVTDKFREAGDKILEPMRDAWDAYTAIFNAIHVHVGPLYTVPQGKKLLDGVFGGKVPREIDKKWVYESALKFWTTGAAMTATKEWMATGGSGGGKTPPQGYYAPYFKKYFGPQHMLRYIKKQANNPVSSYYKSKGGTHKGLNDFIASIEDEIF